VYAFHSVTVRNHSCAGVLHSGTRPIGMEYEYNPRTIANCYNMLTGIQKKWVDEFNDGKEECERRAYWMMQPVKNHRGAVRDTQRAKHRI
jgi:hypothetical protein